MPKIRRRGIPSALFNHLTARMREREILAQDLRLLAEWIANDPSVPDGKWFKRFPRMILCGDGELIKTFLRLGQVPVGEEVQ